MPALVTMSTDAMNNAVVALYPSARPTPTPAPNGTMMPSAPTRNALEATARMSSSRRLQSRPEQQHHDAELGERR
jgi:hypothetical protein